MTLPLTLGAGKKGFGTDGETDLVSLLVTGLFRFSVFSGSRHSIQDSVLIDSFCGVVHGHS